MTHWSTSFLRVPYREGGRDRSGCDCWGIVALPWKEIKGVDLPLHSGVVAGSGADVDALANELSSGRWRQVELAEAEPWDVVLFEMGPKFHVGLVIEPGIMLSIRRGQVHAHTEEIKQPHWMRLMSGVFRYDG